MTGVSPLPGSVAVQTLSDVVEDNCRYFEDAGRSDIILTILPSSPSSSPSSSLIHSLLLQSHSGQVGPDCLVLVVCRHQPQ